MVPRFRIKENRFRILICPAPFQQCTAHPALMGNVEILGKSTYVVEQDQSTRREGRIPEIKLTERRRILVGAVQNYKIGGGAEILGSYWWRRRICEFNTSIRTK